MNDGMLNKVNHKPTSACAAPVHSKRVAGPPAPFGGWPELVAAFEFVKAEISGTKPNFGENRCAKGGLAQSPSSQ